MKLTPEHERELRAIYAELDALYAGWTCPGRALCCQFDETGKEPQLWPVEWKLLARALKARPKGKGGEPGDCPALDPQTRKCRAYADRPFGCRTFFCELAVPDGKNPREALRVLSRRLQELAEKDAAASGVGGDRGGERGRLLPMSAWMARR